ncbi:hypothetical protein [Aestuariirhabdus sp. LZHN29]|uniref:hypothetical protein n=1 Tax=Aestuariirhabdus sp. LZHN29 TaxID=3417462 RepID=UPI003CF9C1E3
MSRGFSYSRFEPVLWDVVCTDCMNPQRVIVRFEILACDALAAEMDAYRLIDGNRALYGIGACDVDICAYSPEEEVHLREADSADVLLHRRDPGKELMQHINKLEATLELE